MTCGSMFTGLRAMVDKVSTRPIRRCGLRTFPRNGGHLSGRKSQHKNREKALKILRARLLDKLQQEQQAEMILRPGGVSSNPVTGANGFGRTIFRRIGSPTTGLI